MKKIKATFYEGLVFCVPAFLTGWVFYRIFKILYRFIAYGAAFIPPSFYREYPWVKSALEAGIVVLMFLFIFAAGMLAETFPGYFFRKRFDSLFRIIPFINFFYDVCRQIFDILFMKSEKLLSHPVLVPFPHAGKQAVGFMTGTAESELSLEQKEYVKVYIPTVPFPTTGFLMVFPRSQVTEGVLTVEQALRLILSGGILDEAGENEKQKKFTEDSPGGENAESQKPTANTGRQRPFTWFKARCVSGMLLLFPAVISVYITAEAFRYIYGLMKFSIALIPPRFGHLPYIDEITPVATFFVLVFGTWFVGLITKTYLGKILRGHVYSLISYIPFAGALFHAFRQLMNTAFSDSTKTFSRVVMLDFPSRESKAIGFITGDASEKLTSGSPRSSEEQYKVFIPGTPNVASGFLVIVPKNEVTLTDLTVQEGLLRVVSGGLLKQATGLGKTKTKNDGEEA
ncbi:MAG: DUF502 domain-containing protein [Spirochaetales bacterium]|jgi:uncharacterized membrane protein|nr:DUF502 domain-containing protein [Spirochaetales bacterium]